MPNLPSPVIDAEQAAFLQRGVSITGGSSLIGKAPSLARVLACRVSPDRRHITLYVSKIQAVDLLNDVATNGVIAAVLARPYASNHSTQR